MDTRAVTIDEVAREALISKGSFYPFFPSREDCILSDFESWEDEHRAPLLEDAIRMARALLTGTALALAGVERACGGRLTSRTPATVLFLDKADNRR